ncbi:MAG: redoxin domain-containing protein [Mariniphaga sp.]
MKIRFVLFLVLFIYTGSLWSQERSATYIPLIGDDAPSFVAETTNGQLKFPSDYGNKWKIIFSHPRDFTPVCSTEILELSYLQEDFDKLGVKLVIVSTDTLSKHFMWKAALEEIAYKNKKPVKINFPLVDDNKMAISREYGMLHIPTSNSKDVRGVFIINPKDKVEAVFFYPMNIGRNMEEIKRTVIALQAAGTGKNRLLTPANWQAGDDMLVPQYPYTKKELMENPEIEHQYYNVGTFMWFKKSNTLTSK